MCNFISIIFVNFSTENENVQIFFTNNLILSSIFIMYETTQKQSQNISFLNLKCKFVIFIVADKVTTYFLTQYCQILIFFKNIKTDYLRGPSSI